MVVTDREGAARETKSNPSGAGISGEGRGGVNVVPFAGEEPTLFYDDDFTYRHALDLAGFSRAMLNFHKQSAEAA